MNSPSKSSLKKEIILLLILSGGLFASYYITNLNTTKIKDAKEKIRSATGGVIIFDDKKRVLYCSKKIAMNSDLANLKSGNTGSNCVFQGCGDFFQ